MSEQVRTETGAVTAKKRVRRKPKTRCFYTDYVNHAIRFYLTTPDTLMTEGKRKADIENWIAVQAVFHCLGADDRLTAEAVYRLHYRVPEGVRMYCEKTGAEPDKVWELLIKISNAVAKRRGLI